MKLFLLVAPLAALCGTAVAVPAAGSDTNAAPQTKSKAVVPAQSRFSSFSNFVENFENALVKDIVNIMTQGKTEDDIRKMRMANSPYFVNIQGIDDVSKFISRVGLGEALNKRSVQAGNPLMSLFGMGMKNGSDSGGGGGGGGGGLKGLLMGGGMGGGGGGGGGGPPIGMGGGGGGPPIGMGGGGMGGGIKLPDFGRILEKLKDELEKNGPKIMMALKEGGKGLGNLLSVLLPVTALVIKLGLGSLAPLTIIVDALLLALLGLGPTVGGLLLKLGLIGEK